MKKEIWFNKRNRTTAKDLIALYRGLGYTDEQIKAEMLKIKAAQQAVAADTACDYDHTLLAIEGHSTCPECGAIPPCR